MSARNTPAAFPSVCLNDPDHPASVPGMALRDWFAGQAPVSIQDALDSTTGSLCVNPMEDLGSREFIWRVLSALRYEFADAMLAAREHGK